MTRCMRCGHPENTHGGIARAGSACGFQGCDCQEFDPLEPRECYGRSAHGRCGAPPLYVTIQANGKNPKYACGRHIGWLLHYRTVPGTTMTVTRLEKISG